MFEASVTDLCALDSTALRELIDVGYVTRESEQTSAGHWVMHYTVRDTPWVRSPVDKWGAPVDK